MKLAAAVLVATGVVAVNSSPAGAGTGGGEPKLQLDLVSLKLGKVDGNTVGFTAVNGRKGGPFPRAADFSVRNREQSVSYHLRGGTYIRANRITADFGELGVVKGTLKATGESDDDGRCRPFIRQPVIFKGTLKLKAEDGLASINETKAKGQLLTAPDPNCLPDETEPEPQRGSESKRDVLTVCAGEARYDASGGAGEARHTAFARSSIGEVHVFRYAFGSGPAKTFVRNEDDTKATVKPGGPFSGSADYADGELTGDLTVDFLGLPEPVALTPARASLRPGNHFDKCSEIG